jgi:chemotaxis protein MotB
LAKDLQVARDRLEKRNQSIEARYNRIGRNYRSLQVEYDKAVDLNQILGKEDGQNLSASAAQTAKLQAELEAKTIEVQRKEDALRQLEAS